MSERDKGSEGFDSPKMESQNDRLSIIIEAGFLEMDFNY